MVAGAKAGLRVPAETASADKEGSGTENKKPTLLGALRVTLQLGEESEQSPSQPISEIGSLIIDRVCQSFFYRYKPF